MSNIKEIVELNVVRPGSSPDVDSDFNTEIRDEVIDYVTDVYGKENVANIVTHGTLRGAGAFKAMCTIYEIPFAQANAIAQLIPPVIEGVHCTIEDIFNPKSDRYTEGEEFRNATSGSEWEKIIEGAKVIESRNKSQGMHACGIIISSKPLKDVIPLNVRQDDGRVRTQFTYPECESLGLIKMDFLGLDTVDLIQHTVENIMANGKTPPNMLEIIHGEMDDPEVYKMLSKGETIGIFQLAGEGVQSLLKRMKPTEFNDIVATTALYRPGPMGMQSHTKYADRKNNREKVDYPVHPEFKGSPLEKILGSTYSLCVYQEQILKIANEITGMTLQEGDDLRSAMGKKKVAVMAKMRPLFIEGGKKNGYSEEALTALWNTIAEFAKYGFNKAHSVAYAMNAYQAAYLKAHYPVEFMSALIEQNVGNKDKILAFIQESQRMGLSIGTAHINSSDVRVSPDYNNITSYDLIYGLAGIDAITKHVAEIIVNERKKNGNFTSVQNVIDRCYPLGVTNRKVYENLALAGAFDSFENTTRKGVVTHLKDMIGESKITESKGADMFSMLLGDSAQNISIDLSSVGEYSFVHKLKREADVIGLYLSDTPLSRAKESLAYSLNNNIKTILTMNKAGEYTVAASLTDIVRKTRRNGGKSISLTIDDGTGLISGNLTQEIIKGMDKTAAFQKIESVYFSDKNEISKEFVSLALDTRIEPLPILEKNNVYIFKLNYRPGSNDSSPSARITEVKELELTDDGRLPVRIRFDLSKGTDEAIRKLSKSLPANLDRKKPGDLPIFTAFIGGEEKETTIIEKQYAAAIYHILERGATTETNSSDYNENISLTGETVKTKKKSNSKKQLDDKVWPAPEVNNNPYYNDIKKRKQNVKKIEKIVYVDSGYKTNNSQDVQVVIEKFVGYQNYDFGIDSFEQFGS